MSSVEYMSTGHRKTSNSNRQPVKTLSELNIERLLAVKLSKSRIDHKVCWPSVCNLQLNGYTYKTLTGETVGGQSMSDVISGLRRLKWHLVFSR
jgi:hypothetical protein